MSWQHVWLEPLEVTQVTDRVWADSLRLVNVNGNTVVMLTKDRRLLGVQLDQDPDTGARKHVFVPADLALLRLWRDGVLPLDAVLLAVPLAMVLTNRPEGGMDAETYRTTDLPRVGAWSMYLDIPPKCRAVLDAHPEWLA